MARRRGLTPEDRELWARVAKSAQPMHPRKADPAPLAPPKPQPILPRPPHAFSVPADLRIGGRTVSSGRIDLAPNPADALAAHPVRMDHKTHKQMTRGKLKPQARLDLHGMTLAQAHPALIAFIRSCHTNGLRLVLVITGKGSRAADEGPLPTRPGALRHQVPHWLHQQPLLPVVMQVVPAHLRHGGSGAYYVYLRR